MALCEFAVEVGAEYVLMNPLSSFGRGVRSQGRLAADGQKMRAIEVVTEHFQERGLDLAYIRFPNDDKPLGGCDIGKLIYVFADGQLAVCPYIVFAARTPQSRYPCIPHVADCQHQCRGSMSRSSRRWSCRGVG